MTDTNENATSFRDNLATIDKQGRRIWVYPLKPKGNLYRARRILSVLLMAFLASAPFIKVGGNPLMLLDIISRKFVIFGTVFFPQDFHLLVLGIIAFAVFLVLFTAAFGRLACGWICPQTIFLEMLFRPIEFLIEGQGASQRKLNQSHWTVGKASKKIVKHLVFIALSCLITCIVASWFVSADTMLSMLSSPISGNVGGYVALVALAFAFYGTYAWFREQVCTLVCPYGRLQSVLLDPNSIVVAYDFKRGEPRGKLRKNEDRSDKGDCIDCRACVNVCPTGIDIRNGTQLECVNCTACIDMCNRVMVKMGRPKKLIRYASYNSIASGKRFRFTGRLVAYSGVLAALLTLITFLGIGRGDIETTILRTTGSLSEELQDGNIRNLYTVKILNKTAEKLEVTLRLKRADGVLQLVGPPLVAQPHANVESVFTVEIDPENLFAAKTPIAIEVIEEGQVLEEVFTTFNGPGARQ